MKLLTVIALLVFAFNGYSETLKRIDLDTQGRWWLTLLQDGSGRIGYGSTDAKKFPKGSFPAPIEIAKSLKTSKKRQSPYNAILILYYNDKKDVLCTDSYSYILSLFSQAIGASKFADDPELSPLLANPLPGSAEFLKAPPY